MSVIILLYETTTVPRSGRYERVSDACTGLVKACNGVLWQRHLRIVTLMYTPAFCRFHLTFVNHPPHHHHSSNSSSSSSHMTRVKAVMQMLAVLILVSNACSISIFQIRGTSALAPVIEQPQNTVAIATFLDSR